MRYLIAFLPPEYAVLLFVLAGLAMIVGARRAAGALIIAALALILVPVVLAPLLDLLPTWALIVLLVWFGFGMSRALLDLAIGKRAADHTVGILAADVIRFSLLAPLRLVGLLVKLLRRR